MRTVVVLPAPFGPEHAEHGAGGGLELDAVERAHVAERLDEAADLDRWGERMHQGTLSTV